MNFREQSQQNENEQCRDDPNLLKFYISQREVMLNNMESQKQEEQQAKEYLENQLKMIEEQFKICRNLEKENETMKETAEKETELRNELIKKLMLANDFMNGSVENFNLLQSLMQLCINDQQHSDEIKQEVLDNVEKLKQINDAQENRFVQKLTELSEHHENCKRQHSINIENFNTMKINNEEEILKKKQNIIHLQNQHTQNVQYTEKLNQEIKNLTVTQNDHLNRFSEMQIKYKEFILQKDCEESDYNKTISDLKAISENMDQEFVKLKTEFEDCQIGFEHRTKFLNELKNQKLSAEETLINLETKCDETRKEINGMDEQLKIDLENYDNQIDVIKKQIEELEGNKTLMQEENQVFEKELSELDNEETNLYTAINDIKTSITNFQNELKQNQDLLEEEFDKFQAEISTLNQIIEEENQKEIYNDKKEQELKVEQNELNEEYDVINLQNDAASAEAEADEITINLNIESLKNEIKKENLEIQKEHTEIQKCISKGNEIMQQLDKEFKEKKAQLNLEFAEVKKELNERYQSEQKKMSDELKQLEQNKITLEGQLSELKGDTQNLQNELNLKSKELDNLHDKNNKLVSKDIVETSSSKEAPSFKRPQEDFKIPKNKIPPSKYSSTSDSSVEDLALVKRRKVSFRNSRTAEKKSVSSQKNVGRASEKSIDDIFEAMKSDSENKRRKRSIKKPVY